MPNRPQLLWLPLGELSSNDDNDNDKDKDIDNERTSLAGTKLTCLRCRCDCRPSTYRANSRGSL